MPQGSPGGSWTPVELTLGDDEKRILLGDPDVMNTRLGALENQMQSILQQNQQLIHDVQQQSQYINQQAKQLNLQEQKIQQQSTDIRQQTNRIQSLEEENKKLKIDIFTGRGSTYTRWGRTVCPTSGVELVYSGYAAGQEYYHASKHEGGPTNTLCLPRDPDMSNRSFSTDYSSIYGTEYQSNIFAHDSADNDMPCAVCRNSNTTSSIMIPGRRSCYSGWTKEYQGILASGANDYKPSTYICIDANPEYLVSGERDENGHLFYPVKTQCVPLPCPPYHNNILVECVVCSK